MITPRNLKTLLATLAFAPTLALSGCTPGSISGGNPDPDPIVDPDTDPDPDPNGTLKISGDVTEGATWSGAIELTGNATIKPGAAITITAGASFKAAAGATLRVEGTLSVEGTEASPVTINPLADTAWPGIVVESGGSATLTYATGTKVATLLYCHTGALACNLSSVEFTGLGSAMIAESPATIDKSHLIGMANGGITVNAGGDLTITDSYIMTSTHDLIVQSRGSKLTIDHSEIGDTQGSYDHCGLHVGGGDALTITNSNIISSVYGMMLYTTNTNVTIQYNNFSDNDINIDVLAGAPAIPADLRFNYWAGGAPALGTGYDTSAASATLLTEAGPRI